MLQDLHILTSTATSQYLSLVSRWEVLSLGCFIGGVVVTPHSGQLAWLDCFKEGCQLSGLLESIYKYIPQTYVASLLLD